MIMKRNQLDNERSELRLCIFGFLLSLLSSALLFGVTTAEGETLQDTELSLERNEAGAVAAREGDLKKARRLFREALQHDSGNLTAAFNLGSVNLQLGENGAAVELLTPYAEKSGDAGITARLGDAHFANEELSKAEKWYRRALKIDAQYPDVRARLGSIYTMRKEFDQAITVFLEAVDQEPSNVAYLQNLSNLFLAVNETEKAISTAKRALQVDASMDSYFLLGSVYEQQRDWSNALIAYERARDLSHGSRENGERRAEIRERIAKVSALAGNEGNAAG